MWSAFWAPFQSGTVGPELSSYDFTASMKRLAQRDCVYHCGGSQGGIEVAEDFFVMLLSGFDVVAVDTHSLVQINDHTACGHGHLCLKHTRSFVSWAPSDKEFNVPFSSSLEACADSGRLTSVAMDTNLVSSLLAAGCPADSAACVANTESMKMLVALRRVKVKSSIISLNALISASKKQETWASALGIM
jgi:hypothetical protein